MVLRAIFCIQTSYNPKGFQSAREDKMTKRQCSVPTFVDGRYAKFYSLSSESLRVGPKCNGSSARPDSFHPAEASRGEKAASVRLRIVDCFRPTRRLRRNESLDPGVRIHHGRKQP